MTENNAAQILDAIRTAGYRDHPTNIERKRVGAILLAVEPLLSKLRAEGVQAGDERQSFSDWAWRKDGLAIGHMDGQEAAWEAWQERARRAALASAPVAATYVEARECAECNHVGINDSSDTLAACTQCDWSGDSPKDDHCPGCARDGTMTAACPKCGGQYRLLADRMLGKASAPVAGEAATQGLLKLRGYHALVQVVYELRQDGNYSDDEGDETDALEELIHAIEAHAAPQASEAVRDLLNDALYYLKGNLPDSAADHAHRAAVIARVEVALAAHTKDSQ